MKEVYSLVTAHAKKNGRGQYRDTSPIIVNFEKYFVSLQELANSMMPCGELKNIVVELGLEAINHSMDSSEKKVVMPLRMGVSNSRFFYFFCGRQSNFFTCALNLFLFYQRAYFYMGSWKTRSLINTSQRRMHN